MFSLFVSKTKSLLYIKQSNNNNFFYSSLPFQHNLTIADLVLTVTWSSHLYELFVKAFYYNLCASYIITYPLFIVSRIFSSFLMTIDCHNKLYGQWFFSESALCQKTQFFFCAQVNVKNTVFLIYSCSIFSLTTISAVSFHYWRR